MSWEKNRKRVQLYNEALGKLEKTHQSKVRDFIENRCLEKISEGYYICKPIDGYNKTTHHLKLAVFRGEYQCSCQGFRTNGRCSHVDALGVVLKMNNEALQPSLF